MCSIIVMLMLAFAGFFGYETLSVPDTSAMPPVIAEATVEATAESTVAEAAATPTSTPTAAASAFGVATVESPALLSCATQPPTSDMANMLQLVDGTVFQPPLWTSQGSLQSDRTTSAWRSDQLGALVYLEYLHYDCGYTEAQIDAYYNADNWAVVFANYDSYEQTAACRSKGTRLYEFDVTLRGSDYLVRYWVVPATSTRLAGLMLVFPVTQQAEMAHYAGKLFPELPTCEEAAG